MQYFERPDGSCVAAPFVGHRATIRFPGLRLRHLCGTYAALITTTIPPPRILMLRSPTLPSKENSDGPATLRPSLRSSLHGRRSLDVFGEFIAYADYH